MPLKMRPIACKTHIELYVVHIFCLDQDIVVFRQEYTCGSVFDTWLLRCDARGSGCANRRLQRVAMKTAVVFFKNLPTSTILIGIIILLHTHQIAIKHSISE
jgi:hypothetical protein